MSRARRTALGGLALVLLLGAAACSSEQPPTPEPTSVPTSLPSDSDDPVDLPTPPAVPESVVQPLWDPRTASNLPPADIGLPASLDPPDDAPELTSMSPAVAMVEVGRGLGLVDREGSWHRVALPEEPLRVPFYAPTTTRLSTDGTHVVLLGRTALWSRDVGATSWRELDYPDGFLGGSPRRRKVPQVVPMAGANVVLIRGRAWSVDLDDAVIDEHPAPSGPVVWGGDDVFVEAAFDNGTDVPVLGWGPLGDPLHEFRVDGLSTLATTVAADTASVAAVRGACLGSRSGGLTRKALVALDLDDLSARGYLPVRDPLGDYTCGSQLLPIGWVDPDTVLVSAAVVRGPGAGERILLTWQVETGELRRVGAVPGGTTYDIAVGAL